MGRNPRRRRNIPKFVATPGIPTLGIVLRLIREDLGHTRDSACEGQGLSPSYLYQIESGKAQPKLETLEALIDIYKVDPLLTRHLRELRAPALHLDTVDALRACVRTNPDWMDHLDDLEQRHTLAAYVDPVWNILACNATWLNALPGIEETESIIKWLFSPIAKEVFTDWNREAAHNIAYDKAILGLFRESEQAHDVVRTMSGHPEYRRLWAASLNVTYGRDTDELLHHRDPATGTLTSFRLTIAPINDAGSVYLVTAIAKPYSGPPYPPR